MKIIAYGPDYQKFEAAFQGACPKPETHGKRCHWTFKKRIAWEGWCMARLVPYVEPKTTLTTAVIKPLTPYEFLKAFNDTPTMSRGEMKKRLKR
jgi:hypothetical protein